MAARREGAVSASRSATRDPRRVTRLESAVGLLRLYVSLMRQNHARIAFFYRRATFFPSSFYAVIRVWFAPESVWTQTPKGSTPCLFLTSPTEPTCTGSCVRCSGSIGSYSSYPVRAYDQIKFACRAYSYCIDVVCMCSARRHFCSVRASLVSALRHRPPPASAN